MATLQAYNHGRMANERFIRGQEVSPRLLVSKNRHRTWHFSVCLDGPGGGVADGRGGAAPAHGGPDRARPGLADPIGAHGG
jgi:hypothetical protein